MCGGEANTNPQTLLLGRCSDGATGNPQAEGMIRTISAKFAAPVAQKPNIYELKAGNQIGE